MLTYFFSLPKDGYLKRARWVMLRKSTVGGGSSVDDVCSHNETQAHNSICTWQYTTPLGKNSPFSPRTYISGPGRVFYSPRFSVGLKPGWVFCYFFRFWGKGVFGCFRRVFFSWWLMFVICYTFSLFAFSLFILQHRLFVLHKETNRSL